MKKKILITADQFDAIHIAALAFGGIGAGRWAETYSAKSNFRNAPYCAIGALRAAGDDLLDCAFSEDKLYPLSHNYAFSPEDDNDRAVRAINKRKGKTGERLNDRVPFGAWVKEMNLDIAPEVA
jgi:hypothetical protein